MKTSQIQIGKTYTGKGLKNKEVVNIRDNLGGFSTPDKQIVVFRFIEETTLRTTTLLKFARWASWEVPEESPPLVV